MAGIYSLLLLLGAAMPLVAQTSSMRVTPPSPTASTLGRFGDVPVQLSSGVPDISIPLFTAKGRTLELPIAARYHAAGIRVEEVGGWLGMGWSLDAGGVITRTVRGLVDESATGYYNTAHQFFQPGNWPSPPANIITDIESEQLDGEPDQFFFSFAGRTGQFVMGPTSTSTTIKEVRTIPFQKLRIQPLIISGSIASWVLQTEDGTRYTFGAAETTTDFNTTNIPFGTIPVHFNEAFTTSWHLTEIRSPGGDVMTLTYVPYNTRYRIGGYEEQFLNVTGPPGCAPSQFVVTNEYTVQAQRLSTIVSAAHTVTFVTTTQRSDARSPAGAVQEPELDSMRVQTPGGTVLRRFRFEHGYTIGSPGRLTLRNIYELDVNHASLPPYSFDYTTTAGSQLPHYSSRAQDHWGYYNGRIFNTTLLPTVVTPTGVVIQGADRKADSLFATDGVLRKVTFPTGGSNEFIFESNDYGAIGGSGIAPKDGGQPQSVTAESELSDGIIDAPLIIGGTESVLATVIVSLNEGARCSRRLLAVPTRKS